MYSKIKWDYLQYPATKSEVEKAISDMRSLALREEIKYLEKIEKEIFRGLKGSLEQKEL